MTSLLQHKTKQLIHQSSPGHFLRRANTAKTMRSLADQLGFVYFGYVDQTDDDHRLVRGLTASNTHHDHHYTVGTFKSYDIALLIRRDALTYRDKRIKDHYWTIVTADLHTSLEIPHVYIGHHSTRDLMIAKYSRLSAIPLVADSQAMVAFNNDYALYGSLEYEHLIRSIIPPALLGLYSQHAQKFSVEVIDNTVHVYAIEKHPSKPMLEKMLNFAIWMAQSLDTTARDYHQRYLAG